MSGYLVESILPCEEVHLLGGPSGAGKTRWLLQTLLEWEKGFDFLGRKSYPVPWVYVSSDRSQVSVERTLGGMGINTEDIAIIPAWDKSMNWYAILDAIEATGAKLAVIESFGSFVDPPCNSHQVKKFINSCAAFCRKFHCTFMGVVESPKMKPYERYELPRQRISGAAAWAHFSETIFLVEPTDTKTADSPFRTLHVCPRNAAPLELKLTFNEKGQLLYSHEGGASKSLINSVSYRKPI